MTPRPALIALGANLPLGGTPPEATVRSALARLRAIGPLRASPLYTTPAWPSGAGPDFVNACARIVTDLTAPALLARLHAIEAAMGRVRRQRWGARTVDIDLLALGGEVRPSRALWAAWARLPAAAQIARAPRRLVLPHPRLADRAFVLVPLADVAPLWRHPVTGRTVRAMAAALPPGEVAAIRRIG